MNTDRRRAHAQHGFSLIEIMIGIVIGMIAVLVIFQVFALAEGIKRNTTSVGDAQQNGLLSSFILNVQLANANNGYAYAMKELGTCTPTANPATTFRPLPVLITPGALVTDPDSFVLNFSQAQRMPAPAPFIGPAAANADYTVQSPLGFKAGDIVVAISLSGDCKPSRVNSVTGPDVNGVVTISHTGAPVGFGTDSVLLNLGPTGSSGPGQRVAYDVASGVLRSTNLWDNTGAALGTPVPNPIASNIINMKMLYGVDNLAGGLDWVAPTGIWDPAALLTAPNSTLARIRAVRIGLVVQGEQWDKTAPDYTWTLFEGGTQISHTITAVGGNYRYRTYETTIPRRNPIWNPMS
jgi:type IV pilus assembly protein PilW